MSFYIEFEIQLPNSVLFCESSCKYLLIWRKGTPSSTNNYSALGNQLLGCSCTLIDTSSLIRSQWMSVKIYTSLMNTSWSESWNKPSCKISDDWEVTYVNSPLTMSTKYEHICKLFACHPKVAYCRGSLN